MIYDYIVSPWWAWKCSLNRNSQLASPPPRHACQLQLGPGWFLRTSPTTTAPRPAYLISGPLVATFFKVAVSRMAAWRGNKMEVPAFSFYAAFMCVGPLSRGASLISLLDNRIRNFRFLEFSPLQKVRTLKP